MGNARLLWVIHIVRHLQNLRQRTSKMAQRAQVHAAKPEEGLDALEATVRPLTQGLRAKPCSSAGSASSLHTELSLDFNFLII